MTTTINNEHKKLNVPNSTDRGNVIRNVPALRFPEFTEEWVNVSLKDVADFQKERISSGLLDESTYISTENILQNFQGVQSAISIPANTNVVAYKKNDILLSNIRPYLKKVWFSDKIGGCSADVFVLRSKTCEPKFLYNVIASDKFINYVMSGAKGVKMPRGDKNQMESFSFSIPAVAEQRKISRLFQLLDEKIATQNKIIDKLQSLIKGISNRIFASIQGIEYRMGDIVTITNGNSNVQDAVTQSKDGLYPFFDRSEDIKYLPTFLFDKEAIIYPGEGTEFMPRYFKGKFALHQRCYAIFDFNEIINARFLYFYLKTRNSYFVKNAVGSTVPSLRLDTFQKLKVIIPSTKTQHSVSLCLSSMEQKCNVEKKILHKLLKQKQYLLRQMFI